jgi:type II secretory pathway component PulF
MHYGNDTAAAYAFVMIVVLVFVAALAYAYLIPSINGITKQMNKQIDAGQLSEQTVFVYNWNLGFFQNSIGIGLVGFVIFGIVRAIEVADSGSGG